MKPEPGALSRDLDITLFARAKKLFYELKTTDARAMMLRQMITIQRRCPDHIQLSEIPFDR